MFKAIYRVRVRSQFVGKHGLDLVPVMQRGASVGHDDFRRTSRPSKNFR